MKTQIKALSIIALTAMLTIACSKKNSNGSAATPPGAGGNNTTNVILSVHYYKGGFFVPPTVPNWSRDLNIDFTNYTTGYLVTSEHTDSLCFKANGRLTSAESTLFLDLVSQLQLFVSTGPVIADAGVEYIEFTLQDGSKRKYHLLDAEVPAGEYYAGNPDDVIDFLRDLDDSLPVACQ